MIYTVFPKDENEMPQDFPSYKEAKETATNGSAKDNMRLKAQMVCVTGRTPTEARCGTGHKPGRKENEWRR